MIKKSATMEQYCAVFAQKLTVDVNGTGEALRTENPNAYGQLIQLGGKSVR